MKMVSLRKITCQSYGCPSCRGSFLKYSNGSHSGTGVIVRVMEVSVLWEVPIYQDNNKFEGNTAVSKKISLSHLL